MDTYPTRPGMRLRLLQGGLRALQVVQRRLFDAQVLVQRRITLDHRFKRRPDDVFISTFPKSGTTLVQMIVHQLRGDGSMDIPHICAVVPWLEAEVMGGNYAFLDALPSPRVFKTHLLYDYLPPGGRYIYVVRDVREVFISGYHQQCRMMGYKIPPADFARLFEVAPPHVGNWFEHLESWWPHRNDPGVLSFTFEGLTRDLPNAVRRVAALCGLPLDESQMPRILERCSVEFMKRYDHKFDPRMIRIEDVGRYSDHDVPGAWNEGLPAPQQEALENEVRALARKLGGGSDDPFAYLARGGRRRGGAATPARDPKGQVSSWPIPTE